MSQHPHQKFKKLERRIPLIDMRRIERYGPCEHRAISGRRKPCSSTSMRDDTHFASCVQSGHSRSPTVLEYR